MAMWLGEVSGSQPMRGTGSSIQDVPPPGSLSGLRGKNVTDPGSHPSLGPDTS